MDVAVDWTCPHCGTDQWSEVDPEVSENQIYMDCGLCCRPVRLFVRRQRDGRFEADPRLQ